MITNIKQNCMGTLSFDGKFGTMRKAQDFIVYPIKSTDFTEKIMIQSDTRIGYVYLTDGRVDLCPPVSSGAYQPHLIFVSTVDKLTAEELSGLKFRMVQTASEKAGRNSIGMTCDNSGADKVSIFCNA